MHILQDTRELHVCSGANLQISAISMAGAQNLAAGQIAGDLGHDRIWEAWEKKEHVEGIPF
jgi:hypothetical protein